MRSALGTSLLAAAAFFGVASRDPGDCLAEVVTTLGDHVPPHSRLAVERIEHTLWDHLLKHYVDAEGMVDYGSWKNSTADRRALDQYLAHLSRASFSERARRETQLAYWINAYNAVTVQGILREYPTTSIRNHTAKLFGYNIWKHLQLLVEGRGHSLETIEHEILRKADEPRIHFAIVCASMGCPRLLNEAYVGQRLDEQLTNNARAFFADAAKFRYDAVRRTIAVSPIFKWFAEDFGADPSQRLKWMAAYLPDASAQRLAASGAARVSYLDYDWQLNDQQTARR